MSGLDADMDDQPRAEVEEVISGLFDIGITRHGFVSYMRDYEIVAGDRRGDTRWLFTHCVLAEVETSLSPGIWNASWDDYLTTHAAMSEPQDGFVWGVNWAASYPGQTYVKDSPAAAEWTHRLGRQMHEVVVETNAYRLRLVFHRVSATPDLRGSAI